MLESVIIPLTRGDKISCDLFDSTSYSVNWSFAMAQYKKIPVDFNTECFFQEMQLVMKWFLNWELGRSDHMWRTLASLWSKGDSTFSRKMITDSFECERSLEIIASGKHPPFCQRVAVNMVI